MIGILGFIVKQKVNETQNNHNNALNPNHKRYTL